MPSPDPDPTLLGRQIILCFLYCVAALACILLSIHLFRSHNLLGVLPAVGACLCFQRACRLIE